MEENLNENSSSLSDVTTDFLRNTGVHYISATYDSPDFESSYPLLEDSYGRSIYESQVRERLNKALAETTLSLKQVNYRMPST